MPLRCNVSPVLILFLLVPIVLVSFYVYKSIREGRQFSSDFEWPLCETDEEILVLERNQEQHDSNFVGDFNNWNNKKCGLRHFTSREIVSCLDNLHPNSTRPWIHIAHIGDSRIRQQFHNLLKVRLRDFSLCTFIYN